MKMLLALCSAAVVLFALVGNALCESLDLRAATEIGLPGTAQSLPRATIAVPNPVSTQVVKDTIFKHTLSQLAVREGEAAAYERVLTDQSVRSHVVGKAAELDYVARNNEWRLVRSPNAPQNDIYTWIDGELVGAQIKTHRQVTGQYSRDMLQDNKAERFLIPDDHFEGVRRRIQNEIEYARKSENADQLALWERNAARLGKLGRNYGDLDQRVITTVRNGLTASRRAVAIQSGLGAAGVVVLFDGGVVLWDASRGSLTPSEVRTRLMEVGAKGTAVWGVTAAVVMIGAAPGGIVVLVAAGVTYIVADALISELRPLYLQTPLTAEDIHLALPPGWRLVDPAQANEPRFVGTVIHGTEIPMLSASLKPLKAG